MDAGPRSIEVATLTRSIRATLAWMLMMLIETALGFVRELRLAPVIGDMHARQVGVVTGSIAVFIVASATARWIGLETRARQYFTGTVWVALTLAFEILLGRAIGESWERILSDYNPVNGGFMLAGLTFMFFAPRFAARLRYRKNP